MINEIMIYGLFLAGCLRLVSSAVDYPLPPGFKIGAATSAYQIEGAWNEDGKSPNIWDTYSHQGTRGMLDTGDIACDSYHKLPDDIEMVKYLGLNHYRFSLSWSRILPNGDLSKINELGVAYYQRLITELKSNGIEPMITLYHWDLPQIVQDKGGWLNPEIEFWFADYATYVFQSYGADVKYWITFNEPMHICQDGYGSGSNPPRIAAEDIGANYECTHHLLKAHARAYHRYQELFKDLYGGLISFVVDNHWQEPASDKPEDIEAAERSLQFSIGWFANPIYHPDGNYPQIMINRIAARSIEEGFNVSRLPTFSQEEIEYIRGTFDFFSLNSYATSLVEWIPDEPISTPAWWRDLSVTSHNDPSWETQATGWPIVPWGIRKFLNWIHKTYNAPEIVITENGYSDWTGDLEDDVRIDFYREYISNVLLAVYEDGVNVTGYTAWSLMDNLEWGNGFMYKFGIYQVNFNDVNRTRTAKKSVEFFKSFIASGCLTEACEQLRL